MSWFLRNFDQVAVALGQHVAIALTALVIAFAIALPIGIAAARSQRVYAVAIAISGLLYTIPTLAFLALLIPLVGLGRTNAIIAMVSVWWPQYARLSRSLVLTQREQEYVHAAQAAGCGPARTLFRHIFPNTLGSLIVLLTLDIGTAIITFAGLSFLGLGVRPPTAEWGSMVAAGRLLIDQWWVSGFPGLAIFTVVVAINFLGDGIRDWLDPKSRRR